jgi:hypothetical protein
MATTVIQCPKSCTVTLEHVISVPPFDLSIKDASLVSLAILVVWAAGWAIRQVIRTLNADQGIDPVDR